MQVHFLGPDGVTAYDVGALPGLLARTDGITWVDVPAWSDDVEELLRTRLDAHPMELDACRRRNHVPTVHGYPTHLFVVLHSPEAGERGHVHLLELDQLVGERVLVTVHGPINPEVPIERALADTDAVRRRLEAGRLRPTSAAELSHAIVSTIVRRQRAAVDLVAERVPDLEHRVMEGDFRRPEALLEEMFLLRHELITVRTMAAQAHEIFARIAGLHQDMPGVDAARAGDLADQFDRVRSIADGERQFLFGVIDLYQTRVTTKMTLAMERLAVIAAITLPVTALASIYGMNVIVNDSTHWTQLVFIVAVMLMISGLLLRWARKQGWW
ncbi:MAG: magnesium transporter CorA family protein [Nocardioidaceae bacterium]